MWLSKYLKSNHWLILDNKFGIDPIKWIKWSSWAELRLFGLTRGAASGGPNCPPVGRRSRLGAILRAISTTAAHRRRLQALGRRSNSRRGCARRQRSLQGRAAC